VETSRPGGGDGSRNRADILPWRHARHEDVLSDTSAAEPLLPVREGYVPGPEVVAAPLPQTPECGFKEGKGHHFGGREWQLVIEERVVPLKRGSHLYAVKVATMPDITLTSTFVGDQTAATTVVNPLYQAFILPVSATSELRINGESVEACDLVWSDPGGAFRLRGEGRRCVAGAVRKSRLIRDLAALEGIDPEDIKIDFETIRQPARDALRFRKLALATINAAARKPGASVDPNMEKAVVAVLADILAAVRNNPRGRGIAGRACSKVVSAANERFAMAGSHAISMADLCQAAGVSKSALHMAFVTVYGMSPMDYFLKRRLVAARTRLLELPCERGSVKRAALDAGFRDMGRFSVRYRELFGESPSETLRRWQ